MSNTTPTRLEAFELLGKGWVCEGKGRWHNPRFDDDEWQTFESARDIQEAEDAFQAEAEAAFQRAEVSSDDVSRRATEAAQCVCDCAWSCPVHELPKSALHTMALRWIDKHRSGRGPDDVASLTAVLYEAWNMGGGTDERLYSGPYHEGYEAGRRSTSAQPNDEKTRT